ncbi:MAG TPA: guanylate kinase [Fimbriimonadaceae bacterium]|nr:guanylate kinase [Fimbriimonadaceae bacterium]
MSGKLVILSGPSGVGKDTVLAEWHKVNPQVTRVVACTTRQPRTSETDGEDYHFLSVQEFLFKIETGDFLEHKEVHGNYYGTPQSAMQTLLDAGKIAVLKIDVQGALTVMNRRPDAISIFLQPPNDGELERRIRERGLDSDEVIRVRLQNALEEMSFADRYDHRIVNDNIPNVVRQLEEAIK